MPHPVNNERPKTIGAVSLLSRRCRIFFEFVRSFAPKIRYQSDYPRLEPVVQRGPVYDLASCACSDAKRASAVSDENRRYSPLHIYASKMQVSPRLNNSINPFLRNTYSPREVLLLELQTFPLRKLMACLSRDVSPCKTLEPIFRVPIASGLLSRAPFEVSIYDTDAK